MEIFLIILFIVSLFVILYLEFSYKTLEDLTITEDTILYIVQDPDRISFIQLDGYYLYSLEEYNNSYRFSKCIKLLPHISEKTLSTILDKIESNTGVRVQSQRLYG